MSVLNDPEVLAVSCPTCKARAKQYCQTASGNKAKNFHKSRLEKAVQKAAEQKPSPAPVMSSAKPVTRQVVDNMNGVQEQKEVQPVNHIALVVDASGSMYQIVNKARDVFNEQLQNVRKAAADKNQPTFVSTYKFGTHIKNLGFNKPAENAERLSIQNYDANMGSTALMDAVGTAIKDFSCLPEADLPNHSFLVLVVTDGGENDSREFTQPEIQKMIAKMHDTDRWTFAFMVPRGHSNYIIRNFGAMAGNVTEWDQTKTGVVNAGQRMSKGITEYYTARASGKGSSKKIFAELDDVDDVDLAQCDDLQSSFMRWSVKEKTDIRTFVEEKCHDPRVRAKIGGFERGKGYYELTKPELVQEYKDVAIMDKQTGAIFGGDQARALAKIPMGARVKVHPGNLGNYKLFILSTSNNRNLMPNTTLLYRHTA